MISIYLKDNADLILKALPLTKPVWLTSGELEKASQMLLSDFCVDRAWDYWTARAGFPGL